MWKYLEKHWGNVLSYYEQLMRTRDKVPRINDSAIEEVIELIRPLLLTSYPFSVDKLLNGSHLSHTGKEINRLPYLATLHHPDYNLDVYLLTKAVKQSSKDFMEVNVSQVDNSVKIANENYSLPMWEAIIHINPELHHKIVALSPNHPWTLYREAKNKMLSTKSQNNQPSSNQLAGYPQWLINDVDYRIIKPLKFLFQYQVPDSDIMIYCFLDPKNLETIHFKQSL
ncbi:hypothetical protein [Nonlabens ponticola]|uniref:Uncharacterized protein n=1 Tax=Nonlabens ponticola TaxID=2496866 RepID=A0A3S9MYT0_9FLAO|nr:hypothetical protein [Nonlabens ponticola]AZQ44213.1 hypothetical protein EJ995_08185 [Nonlabens ponticola]